MLEGIASALILGMLVEMRAKIGALETKVERKIAGHVSKYHRPIFSGPAAGLIAAGLYASGLYLLGA